MFAKYITFKILIIFSCMLTMVFIFSQRSQLSDIPNTTFSLNNFLVYSYADLDRQLCKKSLSDWTRKSTLEKLRAYTCPEHEFFVTVSTGGRTGNDLWSYASVLSVARQTGLKPYIPSCLKSRVKNLFESTTIPDFEDIIHCPVKIDGFVTSVEEWKVNPKTIILPRYIISADKILPWIQDIAQEFTFSSNLRDAAQRTLKNLTRHLPIDKYTFVGVHVRRTDYKQYLKRKYNEPLANKEYFLKAMEYFTQKYNKALFIFLSDDSKWCTEQFGGFKNVYIASNTQNKQNGVQLDLAVLAACNHTIFDYGTYGEWGSILAGGETIYYNMTQNRKKGMWKLMKNWKLLS